MIVCFLAGFRVVLDIVSIRVPLYGLDRLSVRRSWNRHWFWPRKHARFPTHHELSGNADVLPLRRTHPIDNLPKAFSMIVRLDPLSYGVDALRTILISRSFYGLTLDLAVLLIVAFVFVLIGTKMFSRIQV